MSDIRDTVGDLRAENACLAAQVLEAREASKKVQALYAFEHEAGPLKNCLEWRQLIRGETGIAAAEWSARVRGKATIMRLFGQLVRTVVNTVLLPAAVVKDVLTLGGAAIDEEPAVIQAIERLKREAQEDPDD